MWWYMDFRHLSESAFFGTYEISNYTKHEHIDNVFLGFWI